MANASPFRNHSVPTSLRHTWMLLVLFTFVLVPQSVSVNSETQDSPAAPPRVAIIGAGVGGAFTAMRLSEQTQLEQSPEIDV
mgnify:CR=1 FL=1